MTVSSARPLTELTGLTPLSATTACPNPQAVYRKLRAEWGPVAPVELDPGVPAWLVMGYRELCHVARNEQWFVRNPNHWRQYAEGGIAADSKLGPMMFYRDNAFFADGEKHRRLRAPLDEALASLDEHRVARLINQICQELVVEFVRRGEADLVGEYAIHVPMLVVAGLFGMNIDQGRQWAQAVQDMLGDGAASQTDANRTLEELLMDMLQARRAEPADDLCKVFLNHPNLRDDYEILQAFALIVAASLETTTTWIAQALRLMLTDERFASRLRGGRLGVDDALDEVLWRDPPMANLPARYALVDCDLGGQPIRRGDALILGLAAANADPTMHVDDPWLELGNRAHLAWSAGPHVCPAQSLGRLIAKIAVDVALHRLAGVTLTIPAEEITLLPSLWARCPASLPVRFSLGRTR